MSGSAAAVGESESLRFSPDDALVHQVEFRVGAGSSDIAGVPDLVARFEQRHRFAHGLHHPSRVPAENPRSSVGRTAGPAHFGVDRVHRNGAHFYEQVVGPWGGVCHFDVDQAFRVGDRQRFDESDCTHCILLAT